MCSAMWSRRLLTALCYKNIIQSLLKTTEIFEAGQSLLAGVVKISDTFTQVLISVVSVRLINCILCAEGSKKPWGKHYDIPAQKGRMFCQVTQLDDCCE